MIRSHVIPRHYLEQFQDDEERIWVYGRNASPRQGTPLREGAERGYFAYTTKSGVVDESLEGYLASLEDAAVEPLRLMSNQCFWLSPGDKKKFATYVGLMFSRASARRTGTGKMWDELRNAYEGATKDPAWVLKQISRYEQLTGQSISPQEFSEAVARVLQKMGTPEERRNMFLLNLLRLADNISEDLTAKPWQIWDATSPSEFITTDNPVVTVQPVGRAAFSIGSGFANKGVVAMFPIHPTCCLIIGNRSEDRRRVTAQTVQDVNKTLVMCMERWAYARSSSADTQWLVDHAGGTLRYFENTFVPNWRGNDPEHIKKLMADLI